VKNVLLCMLLLLLLVLPPPIIAGTWNQDHYEQQQSSAAGDAWTMSLTISEGGCETGRCPLATATRAVIKTPIVAAQMVAGKFQQTRCNSNMCQAQTTRQRPPARCRNWIRVWRR